MRSRTDRPAQARRLFLCIACAGCAIAAAPSLGTAPPAPPPPEPTVDRGSGAFFNPAFINETYELARVRAAREDRLLVVVITSEQSEASRDMDRACWQNPQVTQWLREHALAIRVDVGLELDLARGLGVSRVPTVIVYDKHAEAARVSGRRDAAWMRTWLSAVRDGRAVANSRPGRDSLVFGPQVMELGHARKLITEGKHAEAATRLIDMYNRLATGDVHDFPVRAKEWPDMVSALLEAEPALRIRFENLRDNVAERLQAEENLAFRQDWIKLNATLGRQRDILRWFDNVREDRERLADLRHLSLSLAGPLTAAGRYADWGAIETDPVGVVINARHVDREERDRRARMTQRERTREPFRDIFTERSMAAHLAMLEAGRPGDALRVARTAVALDETGSIRHALVRAALEANQVHPMHRDLLAGDPTAPRLLIDRVEQRLASVRVPE
mgnify:CR=1 FL=1